jgi:hypothetical protein
VANFGSAPVTVGLGGGNGGGPSTFATSLRDTSNVRTGPISQPVNSDSGVIRFDFTDPLGSIGDSAGNIGDMVGGLAGGALGALGSVGFNEDANLGAIPEAIGNGIGAVGDIGLGSGYMPQNPTLGGTLGGGGRSNVGAIPGAMADVIGLPLKALERTVAGGRVEATQKGETDLLGELIQRSLGKITFGLLGQNDLLVGQDPDNAIPQDIADRLDAGEITVDQAADEMVGRNAGFTNDPMANMATGVVFDPMNLIGGVYGKGQKLVQEAGIALDAGQDASAVNRFVGATYNAATHAMTGTQQRVVSRLAGPATAGVAQAIGPAQLRGTITAIEKELGPDLGGRFSDALAAGNAHYIRSTVGNAIAREVRKGFSRAAETFRSPEEVDRLIDTATNAQKAIDPKQFVRDVEDYARRTLPAVITRDETLAKIAAITGGTVDDAARALGKKADDLATQQTVHLAYWGHIADRLAEAKKAIPSTKSLDVERLTPVAPDTLTDQRAIEAFGIAQDAAGKTSLTASDEAVLAAVNKFSDLAAFRGGAFDADKVRRAVTRMYEGDYLPQTLFKDTTRTDVIPKALGDLRAQMNEFGYELGFGPKEGWRTLTDDAGEIITQHPFVSVSSAKDPLTVRNGFGRFMDNMFRGITQERIVFESRARLAQRVAKYGINEKETADIHQRILQMSRDLRIAPRGLGHGGERAASIEGADGVIRTASLNRYDQAFLDVIGDKRFASLIDSHDPTTLVMQAFKGNLGTVGLSQTVSGGAKAAPRVGKSIAAIAENLYPAMKFKYNAMFQTQELIESPVLNLLRGIEKETDEELLGLYRGLIEGSDEFRWLSGAEYTLNTASTLSVRRAFGNSVIGRIASKYPDIAAMKTRAEVAQTIAEHPEAFRDAILAVNPRYWRVMEDVYGTADPAAITKAFVKERAAGTGSLPDALRQFDDSKADYLAALKATLNGGDAIPAGAVAASQRANVAVGVANGGTAASGGAIKASAAAKPIARESDYAMETIWNAFRQSARSRAEVAFRTHYFSASRSFFERSINHPYLGLYPASYMYGKVLPEFARFLLLRPFGQRAPLAGAAALQKVQEAYVAELATNPDFAKWIEEHGDAIYLANMLVPGSPTDITSRFPGWLANYSEAAAGGKIDGPVDAIETLGDTTQRSLQWGLAAPINSPITMAKGILDLIPQQTSQVETALDNAAKAYDGWFGQPAATR